MVATRTEEIPSTQISSRPWVTWVPGMVLASLAVAGVIGTWSYMQADIRHLKESVSRIEASAKEDRRAGEQRQIQIAADKQDIAVMRESISAIKVDIDRLVKSFEELTKELRWVRYQQRKASNDRGR